MSVVTREFTVGDQLVSLLADLYDAAGEPIVLDPTETIWFRMVLVSTGAVKVNNSAATIVSRGDAVAETPAQVRYDWGAGDVDVAGVYAAWFVRSFGGETEHFPNQDHSHPQLKIIFRADT